jgi:chemotaxis protein methyltransferase CheR
MAGPKQESWEIGIEPVALTAASFARFANFITAELGIKMPESKFEMVRGRLSRRVRELKMESLEHYADYFFAYANDEEREHLINAITTNKTDFFREKEHFDFLCKVVLPAASHDRVLTGERFKVWSAGSSSGEEAYTLSMLLADYSSRHVGFDFAILGTDVSTKVLTAASRGIYQEAQVEPVPPEFRQRYLLRSHSKLKGVVRIAPELRKKVAFHQLNFMDDDYRIKDIFDAVFFRNVMIYYDRPTQEAVINKICRNLAPGGYLFVGHSESIAGLDVPVKCVKTSVYRKSH